MEKRRETKGKGERERCTQLNIGFQRIEKKDKKVFLSEQCKEMEENNTMGRLEISWKIRDTKIGTIKGRKGKKLTEELYKKYLDDPDNQYSVITHLEPDILEC